MSFAEPRLQYRRSRRPAGVPDRRDAGRFDMEFHVSGCDCTACVPEARMTIVDLSGVGLAGFAIGVSIALLLSFAGHPTETTLALLAAVGIML